MITFVLAFPVLSKAIGWKTHISKTLGGGGDCSVDGRSDAMLMCLRVI
jgi:hypothetical protein